MVRFVGFLRPLRGVSLKGDVGSENICRPSSPLDVAGLGCITADMLILRFFELRPMALSFGDSDLKFESDVAN